MLFTITYSIFSKNLLALEKSATVFLFCFVLALFSVLFAM